MRSYKKTVLYSGDATKICDLTLDSKWIWTSKVNSASSLVAAGNQGGQITVYSLKLMMYSLLAMTDMYVVKT